MIALRCLGPTISLLLLLLIVNSCALTETLTKALSGEEPGPEIYYTIPPVTYIRELPGYASENVATLYRGEQVTILSRTKDDWCHVRTLDGQQTGWIQGPLLNPVPIPVETYYVQVPEVPLRPEPQKEIISRQVLRRGEKVRKLSDNEQGWWRVLVEKDKSLGWVPATTLASDQPKEGLSGVPEKASEISAGETPSSTRPLPKQYFVVVTPLELHLLPLVSSPVVKALQLNDKVEEISQSGSKWVKVKYPETGVQGWTQTSYLSQSPAKASKPPAEKKKRTPEKVREPKRKKEPVVQPKESDLEVM